MKQYRHNQTYNYKLSAILALFWKKSNDLRKINELQDAVFLRITEFPQVSFKKKS